MTTTPGLFPDSFGTRLLVSVDTEEEFEWGGGFRRDGHGTASVPALATAQAYFERNAVTPLYFVDYPIATDDRACAILGAAAAQRTADVGVHLHPWVTPPFVELVDSRNSYVGNLDESVERAKLRSIRDTIATRIGVTPIAYRAGRYGIGPNSFGILAEEGFRCDSSMRSLFDYRDDGGPDFRHSPIHPHRVGPDGALLELPVTSLFIGAASSWASPAYIHSGGLPIVRSLLARTGMIERVAITPEGTAPQKACDAVDAAVDCGLRLLSISFHSPSLAPGHTPYVRDAADLAAFYRWFDIVLAHCARRGITSTSLDEILAASDATRPAAARHAAA